MIVLPGMQGSTRRKVEGLRGAWWSPRLAGIVVITCTPKSLDASGGSAYCIIVGAAKVA